MGRPDAALQLTTFAQGLNAVLGITDIAELLPREAADSSFTKSALDIFNDGRDTFCDRLDTDKTCDVVSAYPISINFNAFVFDANGDGLPDMVAAHRPSLRPGENAQVIRRGCANGHQLHLNRGYRWDDMAESHSDATLPGVGWSSVGTLWQESHLSSPRGEAFSLLNQREQPCDKEPFLELDGPGLGGGGHVGFSASAPAAFRGLPMSAASFSDLNADGLTDVVFAAVVHGGSDNLNDPKQLAQHIFLNTGRGFAYVSDYTEAAILDDDLRLSPTPAWRGLPSDFYMTQYVPSHGTTLGTQDRARLVDIDNDGLLDIVYRGECLSVLSSRSTCSTAMWRRNLRKVPDLLTRVDEGSGSWTEVDYASANSEAGRPVVARSRAAAAPPAGLMVVSEIRSGAQPIARRWKDVGGETAQLVKLRYDNYMREEGSRRALAFETVQATFATGSNCSFDDGKTACSFTDVTSTTTTYDVAAVPHEASGVPVRYPLRGAVRSTRSLDLTEPAGSEQITTHEYWVSRLGSTAAARIRPGRVVTKTREGLLWRYSVAQPSEPDTFGYAQTAVSARSNNVGAFDLAGPETTVTNTSYHHRIAEWRLGRTATSTLTGDRFNVLKGEWARGLLSKTVTAYDAAGRVASHAVLQDSGSDCTAQRAQWSTVEFPSYNAANLPTQLVDNGTLVSVAYDTLSLYPTQRRTKVPVSTSSSGATLIEETDYDPRSGDVAWTRDMNQHVTTRTYDSRGRLLTTSIGLGPSADDEQLIEQAGYNDAPGGPWTVSAQTFTKPGSSFTTWTALDGAGRVIATNKQVNTSSAIRIARNQYDGLGRLVASYQSDTTDVQATYRLDSIAIEPSALAKLTTYDGFDRSRTEALPGSRVISHVYDHLSSDGVVFARTTTTNPRGFKSVRTYNGRGDLVSLQRYAGNSAALSYHYEYDGAGRMVSIQDALGNRSVSFDEGGRLRHATLPFSSGTPLSHSYCYDGRGKLVAASTPAGRNVAVGRDTLGRVATVDVDYERLPSSTDAASATRSSSRFFYDCSAVEGSLGKLCDRIDDASSTHIAYDIQGRASRYETTFADAIEQTLPLSTSNYYAVQLNYGLAGQLDSAVVEGLGSGTRSVTYGRDLLARTTDISVTSGATSLPLVTSAAYDAFDRLKNVTLGNATISEWRYDLTFGHLTSQRMLRGSKPFAELLYPLDNYDANGNLGREQHKLNSDLVSEKVHTYDALDQLATSSLTIGGVVQKNEAFTFQQGNLTSVAGSPRSETYDYTDAHNTQAVQAITGTDYSREIVYDLDGWVSSDVESRPASGGIPATTTTRALSFDAAGCMREASVTETAAGGEPRKTTTRNLCGFGAARAYRETTFSDARVERVYYLPDGSELRPDQDLFVMQLPVASSTVATLAWSLSTGALVEEESGYIHSDMRGSVVARTGLNKSDVATPDAQAEYGAWGDTLAYAGVKVPRYQFTNEEPDPGTGYYYFGARPYDPTLRRWLAPDPLMMGALELDASAGQNLNLYSYAGNNGNNPIRFVDPSGNIPIDTIWDAANVAYDVGKLIVGTVTGDAQMVVSGAQELLVDGVALAVPYVPAGLGKVDDVIDLAKAGDKALDAAKAADKAIDTAKAADKAADTAKAADKAADTGKAADKGSNAAKGTAGASQASNGSYTHKFESGKTYDGKGSPARAEKSAREIERRTGDRRVSTEHTPARNRREAFKQESRRLDKNGGSKSPNTHNRIESPGKKMRQQDGE